MFSNLLSCSSIEARSQGVRLVLWGSHLMYCQAVKQCSSNLPSQLALLCKQATRQRTMTRQHRPLHPPLEQAGHHAKREDGRLPRRLHCRQLLLAQLVLAEVIIDIALAKVCIGDCCQAAVPAGQRAQHALR